MVERGGQGSTTVSNQVDARYRLTLGAVDKLRKSLFFQRLMETIGAVLITIAGVAAAAYLLENKLHVPAALLGSGGLLATAVTGLLSDRRHSKSLSDIIDLIRELGRLVLK